MNKAFIFTILFLPFFIISHNLRSENLILDDYQNENEVVINENNEFDNDINVRYFNPTIATLLSLVPGGGQIYNQSYWKLPIIYGGFAGLMYGYNFYNVRYQAFREAYKIRIDENSVEIDIFHPEAENNLVKYTNASQLLSQREYHRRNRDLMIISMSALYIINILDAYVDAHLKEFEIFDEVSVKIIPLKFVSIEGNNRLVSGISFKF